MGLNKGLYAGIAIIVVAAVVIGAFFLLQQGPNPPKQPAALEKFKASGYFAENELAFLISDAGKEKGIFARNGLDPEFVTIPGRSLLAADLREQVSSGIKIGISIPSEVILARANGVPIKIVAGYIGEAPIKLFVKADGPKTVKDLDGKRVGVVSADHATSRLTSYLATKFSIKPEIVPVGDIGSNIAALKTGRIDAFMPGSPNAVALLLVDSGELRILVHMREVLPKPFVTLVVFATEDLIDQKPELVNRFVRATLETAKYLEDNSGYAVDLYSKRTGAPKDLSQKAISQLNWTPNGRGSGADLPTAVMNVYQYNLQSGAFPPNLQVKIEETVSTRFLP